MKTTLLILLISLFIFGCEKEKGSKEYNTIDLKGHSFYNINSSVSYNVNGKSYSWIDTTKYYFNDSNQLLLKFQIILLEKPPVISLKPNTIIYKHEPIYYVYGTNSMDYIVEDESVIKIMKQELDFPLNNVELPYSIATNSMEILEFNDSYLKVKFNTTKVYSNSIKKDTTYTQTLVPQ